MLVNCLSKVPGLLLVLQDMILSLARPTWASDLHPPRLDSAIRLALFAAATLLALSAYDVLGATLSLLGGLASMCCSLLLPVAFYFRLARGQLRWPARVGLSALLLVGAALVCLITATNLCDMSERCRGRHAAGLALRPL